MVHFLDPRGDRVFKRIFGEHPEILRNFLNSMLPFEDEGEHIRELEYLPTEQAPEIPLFKNSIVDVRCRDALGRQFIVEMQLAFTSAFLQRVLFNASKAYVRQLHKGERYESLCPVYALSLLDAVFDHETENYYHDFRIVETGPPGRVLEGLRLIFVELPKYRESSPKEARRLHWAWLKFLKEAGDAGQRGKPTVEEFRQEVGLNDSLRHALEIAEQCGMDPDQLAYSDRFWDLVSTERTLHSGLRKEALEEGKAEGRAEGRAEGLAEGKAEGLAEGKVAGRLEVAAMLKKQNLFSDQEIARMTGLPLEKITGL